jgi:hypothetical protein
MPYADIEAFRELRARCAEGRPLQPKRAKRKRFGTGALLTSLAHCLSLAVPTLKRLARSTCMAGVHALG